MRIGDYAMVNNPRDPHHMTVGRVIRVERFPGGASYWVRFTTRFGRPWERGYRDFNLARVPAPSGAAPADSVERRARAERDA